MPDAFLVITALATLPDVCLDCVLDASIASSMIVLKLVLAGVTVAPEPPNLTVIFVAAPAAIRSPFVVS